MKIPQFETIIKGVLKNRTQLELSKMTGVSQGNISQYSNGILKPNFKTGCILLELYLSEIQESE